MTTQTAQNQPAKGSLTGRHVLVMILLFFGAVIAINVAFSIAAVRSFPGEDEKHSYVQGLRFNDKLAARAAQTRLGWSANMDVAPKGANAQLHVRFVDKGGQPIEGLVIEGKVRRPATTRDDRPVKFTAMGGGLYVADAGNLAPGGWMFEGAAARGTERFEFERRMTWTPPH